MGILIWFCLLINKICLFPHFIVLVAKDYFFYIKDKGYKLFEGWGLHVYVGKFGAGKTSSMVNDAFAQMKRYPQLNILTNFQLYNLPVGTQVFKLTSPQDILNAPRNTLVLIDEIGTIFNSRDFAKSKQSVPKILFQHLCQCRKRRLMIYATSQRWNFVDKQLRDIVATVRSTSMGFSHPFSRMGTVRTYDAVDYDMAFSNPMLNLSCLSASAYVQTDKLRKSYDTSELIENMLNDEYISDSEILENQGYDCSLSEITKDGKKAYKRHKKI